jgi:methionine-rich copper-binding protein CopC
VWQRTLIIGYNYTKNINDKRLRKLLSLKYLTYVYLLILSALLTVMSSFVYSNDSISSVQIGIFNNQVKARNFFEALPKPLQNVIHHKQLWITAYESNAGFIAYHSEISQLNENVSSQVCAAAKQQNMQCGSTTRSSWKAGEKIEQPVLMTMSNQPHIPKSDYTDYPENLKTPQDAQEKFLVNSQKIEQHRNEIQDDYTKSRQEFLDLLKVVGESLNEGQTNDVVIKYLVSLGKDTFLKAGKSAIFEGLTDNELHILSQNPEAEKKLFGSFAEEFSEQGKETTQNLILDVYSKIEAGEELTSDVFIESTDKFIASGAQKIVDKSIRSLRNSSIYLLRNLEVEYRLNNFENAYLSILTTQPIYQSKDSRHNMFLQGSGIINEQSVDIDDDVNRHTANLGVAYRYLTKDERYLFGANAFVDHQWPYNHSRMSLGFDAKAESLNFAANYYMPISGFKDSRIDSNGNAYEERALEGYDLEFGYQFPDLPALKAYAKSYQYFSDIDGREDIRGLELSGELNIGKYLSLEGALIEENGGRDGIELAFKYSVPFYDENAFNLALENAKTPLHNKSMKSHVFDKVRRENRMRVEERLKETVTSVTAEFNTLSVGLPFDVGGTLTAAATTLATDTSITIPSGSFGIINFSNGAIANLSASGAGSVIISFTSTVLTVEQTGGGFVQFISASGGISSVNVPGGTVDLLGTDIDVSDNGAVTTVQVRSGSINVVPNIGVALLAGSQAEIVNLTIATGSTSLLTGASLETRQEAVFTSLDLIHPSPPTTEKSTPVITALPESITGPQFAGNNADVRLTLSQPVTVTGTPFINGLVGVNARVFTYNAAASTPSQPVFRYVFVAGDVGAGSMTIQDVDLNGGTIKGSANGLDAVIAFTDTILVITDQTGPTLTGTNPVDDEPSLSAAADIILTFNENIQANIGNITLTDTTDGTSTQLIPIGDAQITISGNILTLNPTALLDEGDSYELIIPSGVIEDTNGNAFAGIGSGVLNFTTVVDLTAPTITGLLPADNATNVAIEASITLTFDENIQANVGNLILTDMTDGTSTQSIPIGDAQITIVGNTLTLDPSSSLDNGTDYEITMASGVVEDLIGNDFAGIVGGDFNFTTVIETTPPTLTGTSPFHNATSVARSSNITLTFDENIQANVGNLILTDVTDGTSTQSIPIGDAQITIVGNTLTLNPSSLLDFGTVYEVSISTGVLEDSVGNDFAGIVSGDFTFTTLFDVVSPILTGVLPADNATGLARNSTITLTFDEDVALVGTINLIDTDDGTGTVAYTSISPEVSITSNVITITPASNLEYAENYEVTWTAGAIQDLYTNNALASSSGNLNFKTVDLESTLALTLNITGVDGNIDETNVQGSGTSISRGADTVFAADITIPASPNGVIFEGGGRGVGTWVGFNSGDGVFRARGGEGATVPDTEAALVEVAIGSFVPGDYTLTWEYNVGLGRIRVWLDENLIASDTATANQFEGNNWVGTDNFGYGAITAGNSSLTTGEITTSYTGALNSDLRYYKSQTLP